MFSVLFARSSEHYPLYSIDEISRHPMQRIYPNSSCILGIYLVQDFLHSPYVKRNSAKVRTRSICIWTQSSKASIKIVLSKASRHQLVIRQLANQDQGTNRTAELHRQHTIVRKPQFK